MAEPDTYPYAVELEHITKRFGNFVANDDVTLQLRRGEIHALLGENGAGKSTLMNVLFGLIQPDEGTIKVNGTPTVIANPNDATAHGIGMVHQHFKQVECFTVLQNIILGAEDAYHGILEFDAPRKRVEELCERYRFDIDLDATTSSISVGMQQRVEILKMLYRNNDVLIFDEPTAVLVPQEISQLLELMKGLAESGKSILFITHKLNEIKAVADRCTILRKGHYEGTHDVASVTEEELSEFMVGRKVNLTVEKPPAVPGEPVLQVQNLCVRHSAGTKDSVHNVSFSVRAGEIVCIAGIDGNGQSELTAALTGLAPVDGGTVLLDGHDITRSGVRERTERGIAHVPEDRLKHGLVSDATFAQNMVLRSYYTPEFESHGMLRLQAIEEFTQSAISEFDIAAAEGTATIAGSLSGGNQQKLVVARELALEPRLLIAAQPIRGLDVGAIEFIHDQLLALRQQGKAILLVSFELSEIMNMSDRILVMFKGELVADLDPKDTTPQLLGLYMSGAKRQEVVHA